jgi:hypothetical protein
MALEPKLVVPCDERKRECEFWGEGVQEAAVHHHSVVICSNSQTVFEFSPRKEEVVWQWQSISAAMRCICACFATAFPGGVRIIKCAETIKATASFANSLQTD